MKEIFAAPHLLDTQKIARDMARDLPPDAVILLYGEPGAGKTAFAGALISAFYEQAGAVAPPVTSPTYTVAQSYRAGTVNITHFDLYRINHPAELEEIGFDEAVLSGVTVVEWPDVAESRLAPPYRKVTITQTEQGRQIEIECVSG